MTWASLTRPPMAGQIRNVTSSLLSSSNSENRTRIDFIERGSLRQAPPLFCSRGSESAAQYSWLPRLHLLHRVPRAFQVFAGAGVIWIDAHGPLKLIQGLRQFSLPAV